MQFIGAGPIVALWATTLLLIVLFAAFRVGSLMLQLLKLPDTTLTKREHVLFALAAGLVIVSLTILGIGSFGLLTRPYVCAALCFFMIAPYSVSSKRPPCQLVLTSGSVRSAAQVKFFWILTIPVFFFSWIQAQMPAGGTDALAYHLFHPKLYVLQQKIFHMPPEFNRESLWPYQTEMLFTLGLLLQGTLLAQLFHWVFYILTSAAVFMFGERFFGRSLAYLSALVFIFTPAAFAQSGYAYVDLSLAFYTFLALYVLLIASYGNCVRPWFLSGFFAGGAAATKLLGLGCVLILFLGALIVTRINWRVLLCFALGCFVASGVWYLRSWIILGNPVFPFFSSLFQGNGWHHEISEGVSMGKDFKAFLLLPWNMTMYPRNFGGEMVGPFFLLFLPLFFVQSIRKSSRVLASLALFAVFYGGFLFTQSQHVRFFLSVLPVISVAVGVSLELCMRRRGPLRHAVMAVLALVFLTHMGIFVYRTRDCWPVAIGKMSARDYLLAYERSFKGNDYLLRHMQASEQLLYSAEVRYFYNDNKNVVWDCYPLRLVLTQKGMTLTQFLSGKQLDYVWLGDDTTQELWDYVRDRDYELAYQYQFIEKPTTFNNYIYRLKKQP